MKVSDLTGADLDYWVAKAEGYAVNAKRNGVKRMDDNVYVYSEWCVDDRMYAPSTDWAQGGPIIERKRIGVARRLEKYDRPSDDWISMPHGEYGLRGPTGPTMLIAGLRAFVASKFGDEVGGQEAA